MNDAKLFEFGRYNWRVSMRLNSYDIENVHFTRYFFENVVTDAELIDMLEKHRLLLLALQREQLRAITILDCADSYNMPASQRRIQAQWNRDVEGLEHLTTLCKCFVLRSVMARGILTAVNWFSAPVLPPRVVATTQEALACAFEACEAAGVAVPEPLRRACSAGLCEA